MRGRAVTRVSNQSLISLTRNKQVWRRFSCHFPVMAGLVPAIHVVQIACGPNAQGTPRNNSCVSRVIPAKAGIQPWGHNEATSVSREAVESGASGKPWSVVVFWMLAFASMAHVRKARPVFDRRLASGLPRVDSFVDCGVALANREPIFETTVWLDDVDGRDKPGHDGEGHVSSLPPQGGKEVVSYFSASSTDLGASRCSDSCQPWATLALVTVRTGATTKGGAAFPNRP